jgi:tetratricopeptide (TPR) repeat protein
MMVALAVLVGVLALSPIAKRLVFLRRIEAVGRAERAGDLAGASALLEKVSRMSKAAGWKATIAVAHATLLNENGRYVEARLILGAIDRNTLSDVGRLMVDDAIAWGMIRDGAPDETLAFADGNAARVDASTPQEIAASVFNTLGLAQLNESRFDEAVEAFSQSFARATAPKKKALIAFHLGEAHRALGDHDSARDAYARAMAGSRTSRSAAKARAALAALASAKPYRD